MILFLSEYFLNNFVNIIIHKNALTLLASQNFYPTLRDRAAGWGGDQTRGLIYLYELGILKLVLKVLIFELNRSIFCYKKCFSNYSQQSSIIKYPKKSLQPSKNQFKVFRNILAGRLIFLYIIAYFEY